MNPAISSDLLSFSPKHKFFSDNDKPTPVLLVCIYNKNSTLITHDIIYKAFSHYGEIYKAIKIKNLEI